MIAVPPGMLSVGDVIRFIEGPIDPVKCLLYWGHLGSACTICQAVCPWSKPPTPPHRLVAQIAFNVPAAHRFLVWADDVVYGEHFRAAPPPDW